MKSPAQILTEEPDATSEELVETNDQDTEVEASCLFTKPISIDSLDW